MPDPTRRLRLFAALPLWPVITRAVVKAGADDMGRPLASCAQRSSFTLRDPKSPGGRPERVVARNCKAEVAAMAGGPAVVLSSCIRVCRRHKVLYSAEALARSSEAGLLEVHLLLLCFCLQWIP